MDMGAVRFSTYRKTVPAPQWRPFSENPQTVGDHVRKRRAELRLFQREAAKLIGVSEEMVCIWEASGREPMVGNWPGIIRFLGYYPFPVRTVPERLLMVRRTLGLQREELGRLLGVHGTTIGSWETGEFKPKMAILEPFFQQYENKKPLD